MQRVTTNFVGYLYAEAFSVSTFNFLFDRPPSETTHLGIVRQAPLRPSRLSESNNYVVSLEYETIGFVFQVIVPACPVEYSREIVENQLPYRAKY